MKSKQIEDLENLDIDRGSIIDKIDNPTKLITINISLTINY